MTNPSLTHYPDLGVLGEDLVAQWLQSTGWTILHRRWRSRQGEIDIIAHLDPTSNPPKLSPTPNSAPRTSQCSPTPNSELRTLHSTLAFVEVKTRSRGNWDAGGLLSITQQKQLKLWRSAEYFLATHPHLAASACRFDVALVYCERPRPKQHQKTFEAPATLEIPASASPSILRVGQAVTFAGHQMILQSYIPDAFDLS